MRLVMDFLRQVLQRNSYDNLGGMLISSVDCLLAKPGMPRDPHNEWRNAAWIGTQMIYGQALDNGTLRSFAVGLDVVAHEITHGITDRTARLVYQAQSGAMNESYSDIFGLIISNFANPDVKTWNWEMGEELNHKHIPLRDMRDPTRFHQPAHMNDFVVLPIDDKHDQGGVHTNSGIHNKVAFNLLTAKATDGSFLLDPTSVITLFYLTLTQHLSRTSLFSDSRRGFDLVAQTLFRTDAPDVLAAKRAAIAQAFDDVGIV